MATTPYQDKLMKVQFGLIGLNPIYELFSWCINSKTRLYKRVDKFLADQLENITTDNPLYIQAQKLIGKNYEDTVFNIEEYVYKNYFYKKDIDNFGMDEYWAEALEVFKNKIDDCDGQNSLIYIMCRLAGIGSSNLYCVLGDVKNGYHFYCLFFSPKNYKMVKLDTTYLPEIKPVKDKKVFVLDENYTRIDYLFNDVWSWRC
jgi:hypothetical protein